MRRAPRLMFPLLQGQALRAALHHFRCPLCQDMLNNKIHLQLHLTHLHSVSPDCVEKLIMTVSHSIAMSAAFTGNARSEGLT